MLLNTYNELDETSKHLYFEAAVNPSFNQILLNEKEAIEYQILNLNKNTDETNEDFVLKHARLSEQRRMILSFLEINAHNIKLMQQE